MLAARNRRKSIAGVSLLRTIVVSLEWCAIHIFRTAECNCSEAARYCGSWLDDSFLNPVPGAD